MREFRFSSSLPGVRLPQDSQIVFIRSLGEIDCSFRCSQFDYWIPWTLAAIFAERAAGMNSSKVRLCCLRPALEEVAFLGSVSSWELPVSASVNPQRLSDCAQLRASLYKNRACSVWAGKESILSLNGRTCTYIKPRVQPFNDSNLLSGWISYLRTDYRDSLINESHCKSPLLGSESDCLHNASASFQTTRTQPNNLAKFWRCWFVG